MTDVIELTDLPERFERWLAGRPLAQHSPSPASDR
jgi:hypothetical protein